MKIKNNFNNEEQKLFLANFYCFLNYSKNDFFIDVDTIWKWLGFTRINECIKKNFKENKDYIIKTINELQQEKPALVTDKAGYDENNHDENKKQLIKKDGRFSSI
jgi:hypothetical protein